MENLTLEEKIAQMFLIELQEKEITEKTLQMISKYKIGGIIIYRKNYDNYDEMLSLINKLKQANRENKIPLFISVDQEGGRVNRMPSEIKNLKSAGKIAATGDEELIKESSRIISKMLLSLGIKLNYAPVLDIKRFEDKHAIGDRCFGDNKEKVSKYGTIFMKEMQEAGVISAIKHFPGHGATVQDSHFTLPIVTKKKEELEKEDLVPFEIAIQNGADAVMVSHIVIKDIDKKHPASLSKEVIQQLLIGRYNFKGLIITDDLKMLAIKLRYSTKKATKLAINAGNDIVMLGFKYGEIVRIIKYIAKQVRNGNIDQNRIEGSVQKIIEIKEKYNVNDDTIKGIDIESINKQIEELNKKV